MRLAAAEYDRCAEMFRSLSPAQWAMPTDCPAWDVRQMGAHMLGMAEMAASIRENIRQQRKATKMAGSGGVYIDALTQLQVDERADWTPERITARFAARGPKSAVGRRRTPAEMSTDASRREEPWTALEARSSTETAPFPVCWVVAQACCDGVQHDVANRVEEVRLRLDRDRGVARLEEMTDVAVTLVEAPRV